MKTYRVTWEIDIEAKTAEEAAQKALAVQRDAESIATVFTVANTAETKVVDMGIPRARH